MMGSLILFAAALVVMVIATLELLHHGFRSGEGDTWSRPGLGGLLVVAIMMDLQAALWVLWGLKIGGVI